MSALETIPEWICLPALALMVSTADWFVPWLIG